MAIEVKQLTINSVFQRDEVENASNDESTGEEAAKKKAEEKARQSQGDASCLDPDVIKADILAACKKLIHQSLNNRQVR